MGVAWSPDAAPAGRDSRRSMMMLVLIPASLIAGFVVGSALLGDPNSVDSPQRWEAFFRIVPLWLLIEVPSMLGMFWGWRAVKAGDASGRKGLVINAVVFVFFTLTTLVGGSIDAFNGV